MICVELADDVRKSISYSVEFVMSFLHHGEDQALKSSVTIEEI